MVDSTDHSGPDPPGPASEVRQKGRGPHGVAQGKAQAEQGPRQPRRAHVRGPLQPRVPGDAAGERVVAGVGVPHVLRPPRHRLRQRRAVALLNDPQREVRPGAHAAGAEHLRRRRRRQPRAGLLLRGGGGVRALLERGGGGGKGVQGEAPPRSECKKHPRDCKIVSQ